MTECMRAPTLRDQFVGRHDAESLRVTSYHVLGERLIDLAAIPIRIFQVGNAAEVLAPAGVHAVERPL